MSDLSWSITDHCCRICLGRVLMRSGVGGRNVYRCACCGVEESGRGPDVICTCGMTWRHKAKAVNAGIRCVVNPARTAENTAEVVAVQVRNMEPAEAAGA